MSPEADSSPRRLMAVVHGPVFGGGLNQIVELREPLLERGWETVAVVTSEAEEAARRLREAGVRTVAIDLHRVRASADPRIQGPVLAGMPAEIRALRRLIRELEIDVVKAHGDTNPHAAIAGHREGRAVVWELYDTRTPPALRRLTMPVVTRLADVIMTLGDGLARAHPGALKLGRRQVAITPPVDSERFSPSSEGRDRARSELGIAAGDFFVGSIGNRNPSKGHEWLARAAARAIERDPALRVQVLGAPSPVHAKHMRQVDDEVAELGLAERFGFLDPGERVDELIRAFDVLVISSVPRSEGIPTVILEAMSTGLPVITTRVGAVEEVVEDGVTGLVVEAEDPGALADAILALSRDRGRAAAMGAAGRERVESRYDLGHCADRQIEAFELALEHRRSRGRR